MYKSPQLELQSHYDSITETAKKQAIFLAFIAAAAIIVEIVRVNRYKRRYLKKK